MLERLVERVERRAGERARQRALALAAELSPALPRGIGATAQANGVVLTGRALRRRFALERELLWLMARLK